MWLLLRSVLTNAQPAIEIIIAVSHAMSHMGCHGNLLTIQPKHLPLALPRMVLEFSWTVKIMWVSPKFGVAKSLQSKGMASRKGKEHEKTRLLSFLDLLSK